MRSLPSKRQLVFAGILMSVLGLGASALLSNVEAGACRCPLLYAPVKCDHNKTYPNQCVADCRNAKNCVPTGELVK